MIALSRGIVPFLIFLIFWVSIIFANFSLFAEPKPIVIGALFVFALSAAAAILLVLECSPLMQHALFGLLTAILALKRPNLALDLWVRRSPHEIGLAPAVWASNRHGGGWPNVAG